MNDRQFEALHEAVRAEPVEFDGLHAAYDPDSGDEESAYRLATPDGEWADLSESEFRERAESNPWYVSNWYFWERHLDGRSPARRAFLRRLEAADHHTVEERYEALSGGAEAVGESDATGAEPAGMVTEWGQLRIVATLGADGTRLYHLRHHADADAPLTDLDVHTDPLDARRLTKFDDRGRYRPLKTAPSLPTGWAFTDLRAGDLLSAMDAIYPATVENWYREEAGDLDVTHWSETAERQTGIYGIIDELDREGVEWIAESCCVDSQCLKRREWQFAEGDELSADGGTGVFPCREPCSLVVAAARKWTTLEREEEREYTFHLTPSEKEQIEEIVDSVAEGEVDDIREADVYEGANRYRARFLRAKRMDDHGNLGGVPTEPDDHEEHHEDEHADHEDDEDDHDAGDDHGEDDHDAGDDHDEGDDAHETHDADASDDQ
ncbi:DR2241 family protein [Salinirubrum litoreum]|uniref:DR2241 family protein n=1 Tax=Salinirubrum litoreum TaxID=1126234 RepID=A0ABD5R9U4_9EURY|nr:DR2241 family protein [Salinirubrum litoreum]